MRPQIREVTQELRRQRRAHGLHQVCLVMRRGPAAQDFERKPSDAVVVGAGVRQQVARDARQPLHANGIESRTLERIEERGGGFGGRPMSPMCAGIVMTRTDRGPVGNRPEPAQRRGVGLRKSGLDRGSRRLKPAFDN
jgi:hypothetical protein